MALEMFQMKNEQEEIGDIVENVKLVNKYDGWGDRYTQCLILLATYSVSISIRTSMGMALVAMTETTNLSYVLGNETSPSNVTGFNQTHLDIEEKHFEVHGFLNSLLITPPFPKFSWSKKTQDVLLSSFFWGYVNLQIPAGQLAHKYGARRLLIGSMAINFITAIIMPTASYYGGWVCMLVCRFLQGVGQGCVCPSLHTFLGKWAPLEERGRMSGIIYGGLSFGTVLGLSLTGFIASSYMEWPGIFYFYGTLSGICGFVLWYMLADTPGQHRTISDEEKRYIEEALEQSEEQKKAPIPWKKILLSPGMMSIAAAHSAVAWGTLILFVELPSYMDKVMGVNIKANGLLMSLPFVVMYITNFLFSWLTDMLISKKYLNVTRTRKFSTSLGFTTAALGLIALAYAPNNIYVVETILITICGFSSASHFGFLVNHVDISPNYAGAMMSVSNLVAHLFGSMAPMTAGLIITDATNPAHWRKVFILASGFYMVANVIYVVFGTAELAEWNDPQCSQADTDEEKSVKNERSKEGETQADVVYSKVSDKCC